MWPLLHLARTFYPLPERNVDQEYTCDFVVAVVEGFVSLSCLCNRLVGDVVVLRPTGFLV